MIADAVLIVVVHGDVVSVDADVDGVVVVVVVVGIVVVVDVAVDVVVVCLLCRYNWCC